MRDGCDMVAHKSRHLLATMSLTAPLILLRVLKLPHAENAESSSDIPAGCTIENVSIYLLAHGGPSRYTTVNVYLAPATIEEDIFLGSGWGFLPVLDTHRAIPLHRITEGYRDKSEHGMVIESSKDLELIVPPGMRVYASVHTVGTDDWSGQDVGCRVTVQTRVSSPIYDWQQTNIPPEEGGCTLVIMRLVQQSPCN